MKFNPKPRFLLGTYYEVYIFFGYRFYEGNKGARPSCMWSSLLIRRDLHWHLDRGDKINLWEDKWVATLPNFSIASKKPEECGISLVEDGINTATGDRNAAILKLKVSNEEWKAIKADCKIFRFRSINLASQQKRCLYSEVRVYDCQRKFLGSDL